MSSQVQTDNKNEKKTRGKNTKNSKQKVTNQHESVDTKSKEPTIEITNVNSQILDVNNIVPHMEKKTKGKKYIRYDNTGLNTSISAVKRILRREINYDEYKTLEDLTEKKTKKNDDVKEENIKTITWEDVNDFHKKVYNRAYQDNLHKYDKNLFSKRSKDEEWDTQRKSQCIRNKNKYLDEKLMISNVKSIDKELKVLEKIHKEYNDLKNIDSNQNRSEEDIKKDNEEEKTYKSKKQELMKSKEEFIRKRNEYLTKNNGINLYELNLAMYDKMYEGYEISRLPPNDINILREKVKQYKIRFGNDSYTIISAFLEYILLDLIKEILENCIIAGKNKINLEYCLHLNSKYYKLILINNIYNDTLVYLTNLEEVKNNKKNKSGPKDVGRPQKTETINNVNNQSKEQLESQNDENNFKSNCSSDYGNLFMDSIKNIIKHLKAKHDKNKISSSSNFRLFFNIFIINILKKISNILKNEINSRHVKTLNNSIILSSISNMLLLIDVDPTDCIKFIENKVETYNKLYEDRKKNRVGKNNNLGNNNKKGAKKNKSVSTDNVVDNIVKA